jgi:predicted Zn-dependent peptidase
MPERRNESYYIADLLSDALGRDKSARLYVSLKKEQQLTAEIGAYITGSMDDGLLIISGKLNEGVSFEQLDSALWKELESFKQAEISEAELKRMMNKLRTSREFEEQGLLNRAMNLCHFELLGDANGINEEHQIYEAIQPSHIQETAMHILKKTNCSLLKVKAISNDK